DWNRFFGSRAAGGVPGAGTAASLFGVDGSTGGRDGPDKDGEAGMAATIGRDRLFALDGLRGSAACLGLVGHLPDRPYPSRGGAEFWVGHVHRIGWIGVDLFFVLSGFLISSLLFKEFARHGDLHLGRFWARRAFKIWPSYFVAYGLMVVSSLAGFLWVK